VSYPILELDIESNWELVYSELREQGKRSVRGTYTPIPVFEIPFLFTARTIIIRPVSRKGRPTWRFAGYLAQRFEAGTGGAASKLPRIDADVYRLRLNRAKLITFEEYKSNYQITFEPFYWMKDIELNIWQYTGPVRTLRDSIEEIRSKVDDVSTYGE
jgi:hypothetical protein